MPPRPIGMHVSRNRTIEGVREGHFGPAAVAVEPRLQHDRAASKQHAARAGMLKKQRVRAHDTV